MSQTYIAIVVMVLSQLLPKWGIVLESEALTTTVSTVALLLGAVWALYRRYRAGGISTLGLRK